MIFVIDPDNGYKQIARLDFYIKTISWKEQMLSETGGDFSIVLAGGDAKDYIANDLMIVNYKAFKVGIITSIVYKMAGRQIEEITITGKMLESILSRRIIKGQMQLKGSTQQIITDIMNRNVINTTISDSNIPMKLNFIDPLSDEQTYIAEDGQTIAKCLNSICLTLNVLYYFTIEDGQLVLNFKKQADKSYILFGSDTSNIYDVQTKETTEGKANASFVKGDIVNNSTPFVCVADKAAKGIHWIETFVDKSSELDSKNVDSEVYLRVMKQIGKENLAVYQIRRAFDSATMASKYSYPEEIFLGDVVTVDVNGLKEPQRIVNYFYTLNANKKEEISFTLSQVPVVVTDIDSYVILADVPEEDLDNVESDATTPNANSDSKVDGIEIVGRVLCIDNDKVDGTIQKLKDGLYRVNIFTWNENPETSITDETTGETAITIEQKPFSGKIYFACPFNILSYLGNSTLDIDNFDNSKTRIDITTAKKGVLYEDYYDPGVYLFENITEENADDTLYYEYDIVSENLNFNFSSIISIESVKSTIPAKKYGKTYPTTLASISRPSGYGDTVRHADFQPANFYADDGDYIKFYGDFAPIIHTSDPQHPYEIGEEQTGVEIYWNFTNGEIVADKRIRWTEGYYFCYDFNDGYGIHTNFKKINYLKETQSNYRWVGYYGQAELMHQDDDGNYFDSRVNGICIIKQDPAFDNIEGLNEITWICCKPVAGTKTPDLASQLSMPRILFHTDIGKYRFESLADPSGSLEKLCKDPATWQSILDEQASEEEETTTE